MLHSFEPANPTYTHPDEKRRMYQRPIEDCKLEFEKWLTSQMYRSRWTEQQREAFAEVIRMYGLARNGLLGVTCFCGQLAAGLGYVGRQHDSLERVGLCNTHLSLAKTSYETQREMANAVYRRLNPPKEKE